MMKRIRKDGLFKAYKNGANIYWDMPKLGMPINCTEYIKHDIETYISCFKYDYDTALKRALESYENAILYYNKPVYGNYVQWFVEYPTR